MIARTLATAFADGRLHHYRHSAQRSSTWPVSTLAPIEGRDGSVASRIVLRLFDIFRTSLDVELKVAAELGGGYGRFFGGGAGLDATGIQPRGPPPERPARKEARCDKAARKRVCEREVSADSRSLHRSADLFCN